MTEDSFICKDHLYVYQPWRDSNPRLSNS